ncbi:hypothetical protein Lalb_Chr02g0148941 [Lupinus albus]|uniref:Uncharacterized protein n=1 Tax=Lupinus albus TaxID=3870 RepID=A0A6A4QVX8_LUPAL|nr:hypothetical protein Lalb_Chr02g0148941 [Lupinus albus]
MSYPFYIRIREVMKADIEKITRLQKMSKLLVRTGELSSFD